jgi:cytochrome P450
LDQINTTLLAVIRDRRQNPSAHQDLLTLLLNDKPEVQQEPLTDQHILAELKTHLFTGFETGACALSWLWYLLAQNPEYQVYLEEEVDRVLNGRTPTWDDIPNLPMTKAIFSESTRLYPPAWSVIRRNIEEDNILGVTIPKNSRLFLNIHSLHHNPDYWENPEQFYPERFLNGSRSHHPFAFLPFGAGPHMCIASHLAPIEMVLLIASIAQKFRFILPKKLKLTLEPCISLRPREKIIMQPTIR